MPNRILKESVKRSEQIDQLTWFEEVVFYRLILTADDYGCVDGRPILLKNELFPTRDNVTKKSVEDAISKLASVGLLCKYTVNGKPYLFFPTWAKHQRLRNHNRKYPEPPPDVLQSLDGQLTVNCQSNVSQETAECRSEEEVEEEAEIIKNKTSDAHTQEKFIPPSLNDVIEYCEARHSIVNPQAFYDYFTEGHWHDSQGKPVKNWKQKIITWENHNITAPPERSGNRGFAGNASSERGEPKRDFVIVSTNLDER